MLYIVFDASGNVLQCSMEAIEGAERVKLPDNVVRPAQFLAYHRYVGGQWVKIEEKPVEPTPEEIQAIQDAQAEEQAEREFRLMRRMLPVMHRRLRNQITQAQYISQTDAIMANFRE